ncbi:MAG: Mini-ribonuclease 3 [Clostridia bacterium]|nr:Mini-ribonuclease 3 [Clostridia bacterium]
MKDNFVLNELSDKFGGDEISVRQLNPLILASIGDAVYSLNMRAHIVATHDLSAHMLHTKASKLVCAAAQRKAFHIIETQLTEEEEYIAKRGRNAHPGTVPKNADILDYRIATALEAVFGYLYILDKNERINTLIKTILENGNEKI